MEPFWGRLGAVREPSWPPWDRPWTPAGPPPRLPGPRRGHPQPSNLTTNQGNNQTTTQPNNLGPAECAERLNPPPPVPVTGRRRARPFSNLSKFFSPCLRASRPAAAGRRTTSSQDGLKTDPRRAQDGSKTPQDGLKTPEDGPRRSQEAPKTPQDGSKTPQETSGTLPGPSRRPPGGPKSLIFVTCLHIFRIYAKMVTRGLRRALRRLPEAPKDPQDGPKTPPGPP